jgi:hypothetical protein
MKPALSSKVVCSAIIAVGLSGTGLALTSLEAGASSLPAATTFTTTGSDQTYSVPANICAVTIYVAGGQGETDYNGGPGGVGGVGSATVTVTPNASLTVVVGLAGGNGSGWWQWFC